MKSQCCNADIEIDNGGVGIFSLTTGAYICSVCKKYCVRKLQGGQLAGGNPVRGRIEDDFYATPTEATEALFSVETFVGNVWEPACGNGMMSEVIKQYNEVISSDLVNRGYGKVGIDFLKTNNRDAGYDIYDNIITNPPFSLFQEFAEKALYEANEKVALFGKLQALEGQKRATFLEKSPLKTVYIFKKRINPLRNGSPVDENGKPWASTMAFAWFVWEKGHIGKPQIAWI